MKFLVLAGVALLMSAGASASTLLFESCTATNSPAGTYVISPTTLSCAQFSAASLAGGTATSLQIEAVDSYDGGTFGQTNIIDVLYSSIVSAITVSGAGAGNGCLPGAGNGTCQDQLTGTLSGNSGTNPYDFGNAITTGLSAYIGSGSFNVASVTSQVDINSAPNPNGGTGDVTTQLFAFLTYTPASTSTPEPGSMILLGGGLVAAGIIGRKRLVRK